MSCFISTQLQQNLPKYAGVLKLQKGYEETFNSPGRYYICGGDRKARRKAVDDFNAILGDMSKKGLSPEELRDIEERRLGLVGAHADVYKIRVQTSNQRECGENRLAVEADHVPPRCVFQNALKTLQDPENVKLREDLKNKSPNLFALLDKNGDRGLCREVLKPHHEAGLTWRNRKESRIISEKLEETLISGDGEKLVKMSLLAANPVTSNSLREDAGILPLNISNMSRDATKRYHDAGDKLLVEGYYKKGVLNKEERHSIMGWLKSGNLYSKNTSEYKEMCRELRAKIQKHNNNSGR
ncbi:uncharacterized protein LOC102304971 [Haplochromis burtoni]|uniref:uncharacterized protein LOC102304971 n=1 Tax=Haplochromis burtoni TaxID=8153 RepID=UPI0003BCF647|nr:uncharacterized protein LOC102304971 [Haplochromis burtoni]XP_014185956.2 uncharacterized protein LOC102304971 [Haplochromis burtoni]XP_042071665.1 uncharacterized protein LOC102304971 [Haplochromis burtoni]